MLSYTSRWRILCQRWSLREVLYCWPEWTKNETAGFYRPLKQELKENIRYIQGIDHEDEKNRTPRNWRNWNLAQIRFNSVKTPSSLFRKICIGKRETSQLQILQPSLHLARAKNVGKLMRNLTWIEKHDHKVSDQNTPRVELVILSTTSCWTWWNITRMFQIRSS